MPLIFALGPGQFDGEVPVVERDVLGLPVLHALFRDVEDGAQRAVGAGAEAQNDRYLDATRPVILPNHSPRSASMSACVSVGVS